MLHLTLSNNKMADSWPCSAEQLLKGNWRKPTKVPLKLGGLCNVTAGSWSSKNSQWALRRKRLFRVAADPQRVL